MKAKCEHGREVDCMQCGSGAEMKASAARAAKIDHPAHYGGVDNPYEAIKVIEAWQLGFCLGNTVKYISRAGKKSTESTLDDLRKARWYLDREISNLEKR